MPEALEHRLRVNWSLAMESLIQRANNTNYLGVAEKKCHWKYDWYVASRPETASGHGNANGEGGRPAEGDGNKNALKFKTWLKCSAPAFNDLAEIQRSDLFDLSSFSLNGANGVTGSASNATGEGARNNSLTVEDIRGAVGDSESNIALSSAGSSAPKTGDKDEASSTKPEEAPEVAEVAEVTAPVAVPEEPVSADQETEKKDAEGDVAME